MFYIKANELNAFYHYLISNILPVPQSKFWQKNIPWFHFKKLPVQKKLPSLKILLEQLNFQLFCTLHYSNVMNITLESADRNVHMCNSYSKSIGVGICLFSSGPLGLIEQEFELNPLRMH